MSLTIFRSPLIPLPREPATGSAARISAGMDFQNGALHLLYRVPGLAHPARPEQEKIGGCGESNPRTPRCQTVASSSVPGLRMLPAGLRNIGHRAAGSISFLGQRDVGQGQHADEALVPVYDGH